MDLARLIREALKKGPTNTATAVNIDRSGDTTVAYSDDEVTIVQRGETEVVQKRRPNSEAG